MVTDVELLAVTVNVEVLLATIVLGLAEIVTLGVGTGVTVTVADAVLVPPGPAAVAT
jgi:hypothetical protein